MPTARSTEVIVACVDATDASIARRLGVVAPAAVWTGVDPDRNDCASASWQTYTGVTDDAAWLEGVHTLDRARCAAAVVEATRGHERVEPGPGAECDRLVSRTPRAHRVSCTRAALVRRCDRRTGARRRDPRTRARRRRESPEGSVPRPGLARAARLARDDAVVGWALARPRGRRRDPRARDRCDQPERVGAIAARRRPARHLACDRRQAPHRSTPSSTSRAWSRTRSPRSRRAHGRGESRSR